MWTVSNFLCENAISRVKSEWAKKTMAAILLRNPMYFHVSSDRSIFIKFSGYCAYFIFHYTWFKMKKLQFYANFLLNFEFNRASTAIAKTECKSSFCVKWTGRAKWTMASFPPTMLSLKLPHHNRDQDMSTFSQKKN